MTLKRRRLWIKANLLLRQNAEVLTVIAFWCAVNFLVLWAGVGHSAGEALRVVLFLRQDDSSWGNFYAAMSDLVIFGVIVSAIMSNLHRRYRPEQTCRRLAQLHRDHAVIIGYSNLGERVAELLSRHSVAFVVLEEQRTLVEDLIRREQPVVIGSAREEENLAAANVGAAKLVFIATEDLEIAAIACDLVRQFNGSCALVCRCFDDDVGDVLSKVYRAKVVSTSKMAGQFVAEYAKRHHVRSCVVIGGNNFGKRVAAMLKQHSEVFLIEPDRTLVADLSADDRLLIGHATDPDVLARARIGETDLVVLAGDNIGAHLPAVDRIRDSNRRCHIICRVYEEHAAEVLRHEPFRCDVISTSRHTLDELVKQRSFSAVDIDPGAQSLRASRRAATA